jgi:8-oxo-dGTP pyrophosphatase MutT (NUDIX family)
VAAPAFDPTSLPVLALPAEPAPSPAVLTVEGLRRSFANPGHWQPETNDSERWRQRVTSPVAAAVLIPIVVREAGLTVLLTERTAHLNDHAGQISFPGGRAEVEDHSPLETALRETEEEIGLARSQIELLGRLPDYLTGTGYRVAPIVALVREPLALVPDPFEVADIFEVPLAFLMDPANHEMRRLALDEGERVFYAIPYQARFIWGATAGMLRNFYRFLAAPRDI